MGDTKDTKDTKDTGGLSGDAIKSIVEEAIADATKSLKSKNSELLGKLKEAKSKVNTYEDTYGGVDVESLKKAAAELSKMKEKSAEESGEYKKLYDAMKVQSDATIAKLTTELEQASEESVKLKKSTHLVQALTEAKIDPVLMDAAKTLLLGKVEIVEGKATVDGADVSEFVKEWTGTDVGKRFVSDGNAGGGATGPGGKAGLTYEFYDPKSPNFNRTKQAMLAKSDPETHMKLVKRYSETFQTAASG